jgi:hypothetical protein
VTPGPRRPLIPCPVKALQISGQGEETVICGLLADQPALHGLLAAAKALDWAAEIIAARRDGLRANMTATLRAMKAAAESSHATGVGPG